jgi:pimeloyl-ACP methyl ester carboxylesterase
MSNLTIILFAILVVLAILAIASILLSAIAEHRNPAIGKFIECQGVRLHYLELGSAALSPVVLFHGNGTMIQDLALSGLLNMLASRHRVLCFDRPGFGYSERPRFHAWTPERQAELFASALSQLGVRNPVVFGHSWGTLVAISLGLNHDFPVRALVLASGYYFPTWRPDFVVLGAPALPVLGDVFRYTLAPFVSLAILPMLIRKLFAPRAVPAEFKAQFPFSLMLRPKQLRAAAEESAQLIPAAMRLQTRYAEIICPVQQFHGDGDKIVKRQQADRLRHALRRSDLHIVREAGHMVHYANPAAMAQTIDEFY